MTTRHLPLGREMHAGIQLSLLQPQDPSLWDGTSHIWGVQPLKLITNIDHHSH